MDVSKMSDKTVTLRFDEWEHQCGDGCCYDYGTATYVNGVRVDDYGISLENAIQSVLEHLGYKVVIE